MENPFFCIWLFIDSLVTDKLSRPLLFKSIENDFLNSSLIIIKFFKIILKTVISSHEPSTLK